MPSNSLEQQAMERVARMYSSFDNRKTERNNIGEAGSKSEPNGEPLRHGENERNRAETDRRGEKTTYPDEEPKPDKKSKKPPKDEAENGLLNMLMQDKEQGLILLLLVLLSKDGADLNLIFALFYLLM